MYQCLGLGYEDGACGEDWWHPECLVGLKPDWYEKQKEGAQENGQTENPLIKPINDGDAVRDEGVDEDDPPPPPGFPDDDTFYSFICWKCLEAFPWLKRYAGTEGFLPPVFKLGGEDATRDVKMENSHPLETEVGDLKGTSPPESSSKKRKADDEEDTAPGPAKKAKSQDGGTEEDSNLVNGSFHPKVCKYKSLPPAPKGTFSLFLKSDFRDRLCHCPECFPGLAKYPQLLEEEEEYRPPLSESGDEAGGGSSVGTASLLDRGERALNNVDRVRAIGKPLPSILLPTNLLRSS